MGGDSSQVYDVIVVGGGPAAAGAAIRARREDHSVLVLVPPQPTQSRLRVDWLGPLGVELCRACGLDASAAGATRFTGLHLHDWELKRSTSVADAELCGWLVERPVFDRALLDSAGRAGATLLSEAVPAELALGEKHAEIILPDSRQVRGRVVLIDDGVDSPTARLANLPVAGQLPGLARCAHLVLPVDAPKPRLDVVIGGGSTLVRDTFGRTGQLATIVRARNRLAVTMLTRDSQAPLLAQFATFWQAAAASGLLPAQPADPPETSCSAAGIALDIDSHVGKRCLLVGETGGFVAAFSNEAIYPALKSGWIAAEVAARARGAPVMQDELATFGAAWRAELADYLRMPNTDLALLMPLVFSNAQMSQRVAGAFVLGRKF
ncbi:MAG: hypothetical protein KKB50_14730 [Planctomycetes bacterium]|nr:hypothetical protein [Planctomycetota bacterium]